MFDNSRSTPGIKYRVERQCAKSLGLSLMVQAKPRPPDTSIRWALTIPAIVLG